LKVRELADIVGISKSAVHCIALYIDRKFEHEKAVRKMGAAFAHNGTKTASCGCFNRVFGDVSQE